MLHFFLEIQHKPKELLIINQPFRGLVRLCLVFLTRLN